MTIKAQVAWHHDKNNVAMLLRWLELNGRIWTVDHAIAVVEKPHKWEHEWLEMRAEMHREEEADAA